MEVLVPVDGEASARETVEHATRVYPDASITVLHVITPDSTYSMDGMYTHSSAIDSQQKKTDKLFAAATGAATDHDGSISTRTAVGSPVREITTFAEKSDVEHIVLGSCGRSGLLRLLFGSVAETVVRRADVSVTVVR
ncbi:universal stress protein [Halobacteria archaeon HArc-gm2]|nr:universal stress protein [Halobacteria archaeon HArc-gm2]